MQIKISWLLQSWSGSTLFVMTGHVVFSKRRVKRNWCTFRRGKCQDCFASFWKGSTLKGKNLNPLTLSVQIQWTIKWYFSYFFSSENRFWHFMQSVSIDVDISCKLSDTICMKFQSLFSGKYKKHTVDSRYLEVQRTLWNTSRYPYLDISGLRNWGKQ